MAGESRTAPDTLALYKELEENFTSYDFFNALRLLENARPDKSKIGYAVKPADDCVRLGQEPSMAFAPSTLSGVKHTGPDSVLRLEQLFFGLFGPNGPLPLHLTVHARERLRNEGDESFARFADIFHHRLLSFFYRAWADAKPTVGLDRPEHDPFSRKVRSVVGVGTESLRNKDAMPDYAKLYMSGRMSSQIKNAEGLLALVRTYFEVPMTLEQFVGNWLEVPGDLQLALGTDEACCLLGVNTTLGQRVWQCQNKFRLVIGPLNLKTYRRFLPGEPTLERLVAMVSNYAGNEFDWDMRLVLKKDHIKPLKLAEFGALGWTSWVGKESSGEEDKDFDELVMNPRESIDAAKLLH